MIKKANGVTRMLCVEDERELREVISEIFRVLGYEVACAENGKVGVEKAENWRPDCILMDVRMPVMNGPEAIRALRNKPGTSEILIYALTAYSDSETRDLCRSAGANGFFTKPPDFGLIDSTIKGILDQRLQDRAHC